MEGAKKKYLKAEALSAVRKGELDIAIEKYRAYLALNPEDDDAWAGLGGSLRRQGLIDQAIESYERAYGLNRTSSYALINIVSLRAARHLAEDEQKLEAYIPEALKLCQEIIDGSQADYWNWYDLATLRLLHGETEEAVSTFSYAAELTPKTATESFRSVLSNLNFLKTHNLGIPGIDRVIALVSAYV